MRLGDVIASYRSKGGLTQQELADKIGVTVTYISLLENNHNKPSLQMLDQIATALNVGIEILVFVSLHKRKPKSSADKKLLEQARWMVKEMVQYVTSEKGVAKTKSRSRRVK